LGSEAARVVDRFGSVAGWLGSSDTSAALMGGVLSGELGPRRVALT